MISFVYMGRKEWRGFEGSALVAWIFQSDGRFRPQLKTPGGIRLGSDCNTLDSAKGWLLKERRNCDKRRA